MSRLQIDMLPVGDGDAFLIQVELAGKSEVVLIDGGRSWEDGERVLKQLSTYYGSRIDHLVLSHIDSDHVGGLAHVCETLGADGIGQAWVHDLSNHGVNVGRAIQLAQTAADEAESDAVRSVAGDLAQSVKATRRLIGLLRAKGIPVREAFSDGENRVGPFEVLGPSKAFFEECTRFYDDVRMLGSMVEQGISFRRRKTAGMGPAAAEEVLASAIDNPQTEKQASVILRLDYEGEKYLFPGDAGRAGFRACPDLQRAAGLHLLKVPDHGSKHNVDPELLDLMKPKLAYISCSGTGINPHPALVEALKKRGAAVYSTHRAGNIWHHRGDVPPRSGFDKKHSL
jgi:beta-lactamase superfamily II metal-dependent hydrolase